MNIDPQGSPRPQVDPDRVVRGALVLVFALVVLRDAWVGDDAYITLRTVDNVVNGRGLVWNLGERVQAFTHPLWMLVVTAFYALSREGFYTILVPSLACSFAAVALFARKIAPEGPGGWVALALLPLSRAFVDYSTSGLENPLTHLLLVAALVVWFGSEAGLRAVGRLALLTGLALTNRMDTLLLFGPLLATATWDAWRAGTRPQALLGRLALGMLPFLAWESFALVYYGSLVPNTALAKLNTGIPKSELAVQGLFYLLDSLERDPLTLLVIAGGIATPLWLRQRREAVAALAALLYVAYVVRIGGDFMSGRFLAAPFLMAAACLARAPLPSVPSAAAVAALAVAVSLGADIPTLAPVTAPPSKDLIGPDARGITDERSFFAFEGNGLKPAARAVDMPAHHWRDVGERLPRSRIVIVRAAGMRGWAGTPTNFLVDEVALADPFLARLPAEQDANWRVGHFKRAIPPGYLETIATGRDQFEDRQLSALYWAVRKVTRGPIWSWERFREIWRLQTGHYAIDTDRYRYADAVKVALGAPTDTSDTSLDRTDLVGLDASGAYVDLGGPVKLKYIYVRRRANVDLTIRFYRDGELLGEEPLPRSIPKGSWLAGDYVEVPARAVEDGYDALRIVPLSGPKPWYLLSVEVAPKRTLRDDLVASDGSSTLRGGLRALVAGRHGPGSTSDDDGAIAEGIPEDATEPGKLGNATTGPRPKNGTKAMGRPKNGAVEPIETPAATEATDDIVDERELENGNGNKR